jgi:hypothetical protein
MTQHDDHIWLTVLGGAWAIRRIYRNSLGEIDCIDLWRGYHPNIETCRLMINDWDWPRYCDAARDVIEAQLRPLV